MPYCGKTKSEKLLSVFSFLLLPPSCGPKNVNIFYRNSNIFHRFDFSSTISLTNGCAFHYLWDHKVFGGQSGGEISAGHLADLRKRLSKVHCALFHISGFMETSQVSSLICDACKALHTNGSST